MSNKLKKMCDARKSRFKKRRETARSVSDLDVAEKGREFDIEARDGLR